MDIDDPRPTQPAHYPLQPTNTLAGPSSSPELTQHPTIFLPPPGFQTPPPYFSSTQDLLSRFQLSQAYDRYVRPYVAPIQSGALPSSSTLVDKGKGKEKESPQKDPTSPSAGLTPGAGIDADDDEGHSKGEKKWKNNYKSLIKGLPGKHSMKKDDYLMTMMQVPPKQRNNITQFDLRTQREAFSVSLEGLKGWNINALVAESPQAREDRKRRKELKKLGKTQGPASAGPSGMTSSTPAAVSATTPSSSGHPPQRTNTPRPGVPGAPGTPSTRPPPPIQNLKPQGQTPVGVGTPKPSTPSAQSSIPSSQHPPQQVSTPAPTPGSQDGVGFKRGVKRERDDSAIVGGAMNGVGQVPRSATPVKGITTGTTAKPHIVVGAKAGNAGVRPRPLKKPRMDNPGQSGQLPLQQPTSRA